MTKNSESPVITPQPTGISRHSVYPRRTFSISATPPPTAVELTFQIVRSPRDSPNLAAPAISRSRRSSPMSFSSWSTGRFGTSTHLTRLTITPATPSITPTRHVSNTPAESEGNGVVDADLGLRCGASTEQLPPPADEQDESSAREDYHRPVDGARQLGGGPDEDRKRGPDESGPGSGARGHEGQGDRQDAEEHDRKRQPGGNHESNPGQGGEEHDHEQYPESSLGPMDMFEPEDHSDRTDAPIEMLTPTHFNDLEPVPVVVVPVAEEVEVEQHADRS